MITENEWDCRVKFFEEIKKRQGVERWSFIKALNEGLVENTSILVKLGAIQKEMIDGWKKRLQGYGNYEGGYLQ